MEREQTQLWTLTLLTGMERGENSKGLSSKPSFDKINCLLKVTRESKIHRIRSIHRWIRYKVIQKLLWRVRSLKLKYICKLKQYNFFYIFYQIGCKENGVLPLLFKRSPSETTTLNISLRIFKVSLLKALYLIPSLGEKVYLSISRLEELQREKSFSTTTGNNIESLIVLFFDVPASASKINFRYAIAWIKVIVKNHKKIEACFRDVWRDLFAIDFIFELNFPRNLWTI